MIKFNSCATCNHNLHSEKGRIICNIFPFGIPREILKGEDRHFIKREDQKNDLIYEKNLRLDFKSQGKESPVY